MRDFFLYKLETLKLTTGLNQFENMLGENDFEEKLNILLDSLVRATKKFGYLSDERKKEVISRCMITDEKFTSLNEKKVYMWLANYWTSLDTSEIQKLTRKEEKKPETKKLSPEEEKEYIERWKKDQAKISGPMTRQSKVSVMITEGRTQKKVKQIIVDCPKCNNDPKEKFLCAYCMGYGKVKKTII